MLVWLDLFFFKTPPTLRRINLLESYLFHGMVLTIGILILSFSLTSIFRTESLFFQPKIKQFLINLKLLILSILFCLIILEVFLQLTAEEGCGQDDPILHHAYQPNCSVSSNSAEWDISVKMNSEGLRDEEIQPKQDYNYRILMLGDSFTIGWGIDQGKTFNDLLEQKFNSKQLKVDVINGGATSYAPILEYLFLKEKGLKYAPDTIILNFDLSDFQNDYNYQTLAKYDTAGELMGVSPEEANFLKSVYLKVKLIKFIESPFLVLDSRFPSKEIWGEEFFYDIDYDRYALTRLDLPKGTEEKYTQATFKYLKLIQELASKNNITLILVAYPYGHQVSGEEWAAGRHNYGFEPGKVYSNRPEEILAQFAAENNIQFISLYSDFKESNIFPLFYPYDGHLTSEGHHLYAESLYAKLLEKDFFDKISPAPKIPSVLQKKELPRPFLVQDIFTNLQTD